MLIDCILDYCEHEQISLSEFERRCGLGHGTVRKYKEGHSPTIKTLQTISAKTGISMLTLISESK